MVNLEQLKKQAKDLIRAARAGDAAALSRLGGREVILANAQLVIAREHGCASWRALVAKARSELAPSLPAIGGAARGKTAEEAILALARQSVYPVRTGKRTVLRRTVILRPRGLGVEPVEHVGDTQRILVEGPRFLVEPDSPTILKMSRADDRWLAAVSFSAEHNPGLVRSGRRPMKREMQMLLVAKPSGDDWSAFPGCPIPRGSVGSDTPSLGVSFRRSREGELFAAVRVFSCTLDHDTFRMEFDDGSSSETNSEEGIGLFEERLTDSTHPSPHRVLLLAGEKTIAFKEIPQP